ncbi:hypothetical protein [Micromonospora sp. NPDC048169]|uniref:SCO4848 family membrane protein n=1 Tax=unclassified Micromonospora TaxID=2617518 RepID=UPI00340CA52E
MVLSRGWSLFLVAVGVWTWAIWPRFALAIWNDERAWSAGVVGEGSPTGFLWVHALLIAASLAIGTTVGALGVRALLASRHRPSPPRPSPSPSRPSPSRPSPPR